MRVYTRIVIDIETGKMLDSASFSYDGPVAQCNIGGGVSKSSSSNSKKPALQTFAEGVSQELGLQLLQQAGQSMGVQFNIPDRNAISQQLFHQDFAQIKGRKKRQKVLDTIASQTQVSKPATPADQATQDFLTQITNTERGFVTNPGSELTGPAADLVNQAYEGPAQVARQQLRQDAIAAAGRRGLNLSDTPVSMPYMNASQNLENNIAAAKAGSLLTEANNYQNFVSGLRAYEQGLQQQNFVNLLNLGGQTSSVGIGLEQARGAAKTTSGVQSSTTVQGNAGLW